MGKVSGIEWTDATWNPWQGCHKVSPGCKFCYMYREKRRYGQDPEVVVRSKPATFNAPLRWSPHGEGERLKRIFTCSWSDFFVEESDPWRDEAWEIIRQTPKFNYLILTKRIGRVTPARLPWPPGEPWPNVWIGTSVESETQRGRIADLLAVDVRVRFLSLEPLLGPIDLEPWLYATAPNTAGPWEYPSGRREPARGIGGCMMSRKPAGEIHWVIVGGETGPGARPMQPDWARQLRDQCVEAKVPFFYKQHGDMVHTSQLTDAVFRDIDASLNLACAPPAFWRVPKSKAGRLLDDTDWSEFP